MAWGGKLFLAGTPILLSAYFWAVKAHGDPELARALRLGCWGGLAGTIGYDVVRIPMHLIGYRVFAPISAYGVWLLEANRSSAWTEMTGWAYHFSNGLTFGLMYALWMGRRHWAWGLLWGLALESIVLSTPFARIFHMQGNYPAIAIAYGAHLAYGLPLGLVVWRWQESETDLVRQSAWWGLGLVSAFVLSFLPLNLEQDARSQPGTFLVEGGRLNPTWLRLNSAGAIGVCNSSPSEVTIVDTANRRQLTVKGGATEKWPFEKSGIYQCYIKTQGRSISSFVIVEPVESQ